MHAEAPERALTALQLTGVRRCRVAREWFLGELNSSRVIAQ